MSTPTTSQNIDLKFKCENREFVVLDMCYISNQISKQPSDEVIKNYCTKFPGYITTALVQAPNDGRCRNTVDITDNTGDNGFGGNFHNPTYVYNPQCTRNISTGDPLTCCFQDYFCKQQGIYCYIGAQNTTYCDPSKTNLGGSGCDQVVSDFCLSGVDYIEKWVGDTDYTFGKTSLKKPCQVHFRRQLSYSLPGECLGLNPGNSLLVSDFSRAQVSFQDFVNKYLSDGGELINVGPSYDPRVSDFVYETCQLYPGMCNFFLSKYCNGVSDAQLYRFPDLQKFCGCYLNDSFYQKYINLYQISKECTPYCNLQGTIPLPDESGIRGRKCNNSSCIIDGVSIQLVNTKFNAPIKFDQVCGSCGDRSATSSRTCNCVIKDFSFVVQNSNLNGSLSLNQNCRGNTKCYNEIKDANGNPTKVEVPCDYNPVTVASESYSVFTQQNVDSSAQLIIWILLGSMLFLILIGVIIFSVFIMKLKPKENSLEVRRKLP